MQILAPGVIHIPTSKTDNAYPIEGDDGLTLVDVGRSKVVEPLLHTITDEWSSAVKVRRVGFGAGSSAGGIREGAVLISE